MKSLIQLLYASRAGGDFHEHDLPGLLKPIRLANARRQLTGMLVYVDGAFFQVLEGEAGMVDAVYASIQRDRRHSNIRQLAREAVSERAFEGWTMGQATVDPLDAGLLVGEPDLFTAADCVERIDAARARKLIWSLNKRRWQLQRSGMYRALGRAG